MDGFSWGLIAGCLVGVLGVALSCAWLWFCGCCSYRMRKSSDSGEKAHDWDSAVGIEANVVEHKNEVPPSMGSIELEDLDQDEEMKKDAKW